ncbi:MAG: phosphate propanoyltransferase [Opitutales bacterium]
MAQTPQKNLPRAVVEHLVRESVYRHMGLPLPASASAPNPLVVNVSARHCHLTPQAVEQLFGEGHTLTPFKWLYQEGQYAAEETVTLIGPRSRVISNLRILGPCRDFNQVELANTDAVALGFRVPVRQSGDIAGTPGCMLMGPKGFLEMNEGVIRAAPHVHMHPDDAAFYGVQNKQSMRLRVGGALGVTFDRIFVRVKDDFRLEVHIDTDEGNACGLTPDSSVELLPPA